MADSLEQPWDNKDDSLAQPDERKAPESKPVDAQPSAGGVAEVHPYELPSCSACGAQMTPERFKCGSCDFAVTFYNEMQPSAVSEAVAIQELLRLHHKWVAEDDLSHEEVQAKLEGALQAALASRPAPPDDDLYAAFEAYAKENDLVGQLIGLERDGDGYRAEALDGAFKPFRAGRSSRPAPDFAAGVDTRKLAEELMDATMHCSTSTTSIKKMIVVLDRALAPGKGK